MRYTPMTQRAMDLCYQAHRDQRDKAGVPYVFHPFHLAETMESEEEICAALLGPHGDIGFLHRIEEMLSQYSLAALRQAFPERMDDLKYTYAYCVAGGVGLIKDWLSRGCEESPQRMAQLTFRLVTNTVSDFYPHA